MKVLFIIYLISIIYFFIGFFLLLGVTLYQVKKEGLKFEKAGVAETIQTFLRVILLAALPIVNVVFGSIFIFSNDIQDVTMDKMREKSI